MCASQIDHLESKLGALHASDASTLRRQNKALTQHIEALQLEVRATCSAAGRLDGSEAALVGHCYARKVCQHHGQHAHVCTAAQHRGAASSMCASPTLCSDVQHCARTPQRTDLPCHKLIMCICHAPSSLQAFEGVGVASIGSFFCWVLRRALRAGSSVSNALLLVSLLGATVPVGVRARKRLKRWLLHHPHTLADLQGALRRVQERSQIMHDLTHNGDAALEASAASQPAAASAAASADDAGTKPSTDQVEVSVPDAMDTVAPSADAAQPDALSASATSAAHVGREDSASPDDLVHVSAADAESPQRSVVWHEHSGASASGPGSDAAMVVAPDRPGSTVSVASDRPDSRSGEAAVSVSDPDRPQDGGIVWVNNCQ